MKLIPGGEGPKPLGLDLALVLDVSGSMYEEDGTGRSRLTRVREESLAGIGKLRPDDTLSVIAFAHNAQVVLPSTSLAERAKIEEVIDRVDMYDVDPGGTCMDQGIALGMAEVEKGMAAGRLSQIVVLTDG